MLIVLSFQSLYGFLNYIYKMPGKIQDLMKYIHGIYFKLTERDSWLQSQLAISFTKQVKVVF